MKVPLLTRPECELWTAFRDGADAISVLCVDNFWALILG